MAGKRFLTNYERSIFQFVVLSRKAADKNEDGKLDKAEFSNFLHPEEADHMRDIVVQVFKIDGYHSNRNIFKSIRDTCLN
jgi:hypothetical protein